MTSAFGKVGTFVIIRSLRAAFLSESVNNVVFVVGRLPVYHIDELQGTGQRAVKGARRQP